MTAAAGLDRGEQPGHASMTPRDIEAAARALESAEQTRVQIPLLSEDLLAMTMDDAYSIQSAWVSRKRAAGDRVIGWKIGLTSRAMQMALGIDIPDSGVLLDSMTIANGATVPAGRFIQPRVEAEIAFVTKDVIDPADLSAEAIWAATDYVAPALEILDTRICRADPRSGRSRTVLDTIADNAANAGIVLGAPVRGLRPADLRWIGAIVSRDGIVEETGLGAGVLGDPIVSVAWLAKRLARYGDRIGAGQIILSGSFVRPVETASGSRISGDFGPFGTVECRFA